MTKPEILARLRDLNPRARDTLLHLWADAFLEYQTAQGWIQRRGAVVVSDLGKPVKNPWLEVRDNAAKRLHDIHLKTGDLWEGA